MEDISVKQLYDYILKNKDARKHQIYEDVRADLLPADVLNTLLLGEHPEVFDYNPDTELDHIDSVLGKPTEGDSEWVADANYEQLPEDLAEKINANNERANKQKQYAESVPANMNKNVTSRSNDDAKLNMHEVILDNILSKVLNNKTMTDDQKKLFALRMLYNNSTPGRNKILPDIKLTQDALRNELMMDPKWEEYINKSEHSLLNASHINTDYLPLTYNSDKIDYDDITWDEDGNEYKTKKTSYLFHPLEDSQHVYDIFTNNILNDISSGNADSLDPYKLDDYIIDKYNNSIRTMPYSDWLNIIDKEAERINKAKEARLGRPLKESEKVELDVPDEVLTPEDWSDMLPTKVKLGKSAAEKADNKLNRHHKENKEAYKEYLDAMADTRNEDSDSVMRPVYEDAMANTKEKIKKLLQERQDKISVDILQALTVNDKDTADKLRDDYHRYESMINEEGTGKIELDNWARRYVSKKFRSDYGIQDKERTRSNISQYKELEKLANESTSANEAWLREAYDKITDAKNQANYTANKKYDALPAALQEVVDNLNRKEA